jgi:hypothetical protein
VDSLGQIRRQLLLARFTTGGPKVRETIEAVAAPKTRGKNVVGSAEGTKQATKQPLQTGA